MPQTLSRKAKTLEEAKTFMEAMRVLGASRTRVTADGTWIDETGELVWPSSGDIGDLNRVWVTYRSGTESYRIKPWPGRDGLYNASLTVTATFEGA